MSEITADDIKALFTQLVNGKSDACGKYLGVSGQYIRQLCSMSEDDKHKLPSILQITRLEHWRKQPVVTGWLAASAKGDIEAEDVKKQTREATYAVVELQRIAETDAPRKVVHAAIVTARKELDDTEAALLAANGN